jgi:predicted dehydrogenase
MMQLEIVNRVGIALRLVLVGVGVLGISGAPAVARAEEAASLRVGIVGLDSSHAVAFARLLNEPGNAEHVAGARVVAAYRGGSPDVKASTDRIDGFTAAIRELGVEIVPTIEGLLAKVDAVMVLSVDGRAHLPQAKAVFGRGKPVFIDKPLAASYRDGREILRQAAVAGSPVFSASATRFYPSVLLSKADATIGQTVGAHAYSPGTLEPHHPDLFWYGVHAVEMLYAVMGPGCESVARTSTPDADVVVGRWKDGRIGTVRTVRREFREYGVVVFGASGMHASPCDAGAGGYRNLVQEIVGFFRRQVSPVPSDEMLEVLAFMEAAELSQERGGRRVSLSDVH